MPSKPGAVVSREELMLLQAGAMSERQLQTHVLEYARQRGWRSVHFRTARTKTGWTTAVEGDGVGFPDMVLVRAGRLVFAELKSQKAPAPKDEQLAWLNDLYQVEARAAAAGLPYLINAHIWRPIDYLDGTIEGLLR